MIPKIVVRACRKYQQYIEDQDDIAGDEYPAIWSEWMDPSSMRFTGGWYTDPPYESKDAMGMGEVIDLSLTLWEAVDFIENWHGAVWDYSEGEYSTDDYRTGRQSMDTLFIHSGPIDTLNEMLNNQREEIK